MMNGTIIVEGSCETEDYVMGNDRLKIHVDGDENTYKSVDELPNKRVHVYDWTYTFSHFDPDFLEIWCENKGTQLCN
jgi:hypothetical protein